MTTRDQLSQVRDQADMLDAQVHQLDLEQPDEAIADLEQALDSARTLLAELEQIREGLSNLAS